MKKLRCDLTLFYLTLLLLSYWPFAHYGRCSEENKSDLQTRPQTAQDDSEQQDETRGTVSDKDPPSHRTTEHQTQSDAVTVDEHRTRENGSQEEEGKETSKDFQADRTPALPCVTEHGPEPSVRPALGSQSAHLSPDPDATLSAGQRVDVSETASECSDGDSCTSASLGTVPPTAACDAGETPQCETDGNGLPAGLENGSTSEAGEILKDGLDTAGSGTNASSMLKELGTETESNLNEKAAEDIPTFDEWKKIIMEVENEKSQSTHTSCNGGSSAVKKVQKTTNYASVECGAKILSSNPEAKSTSAILMENVDVYMLNPCSNKIWFIIELCQPIQVKQLDIANFELFSSTPKDFLVSISDRYPTSKWSKLGTFHARDERTVQSFPLDEHLYAKYVKMFTKYIKVELLSHFGSEHFCPLSLIRVFGTSMMEEYELNSEASERLGFQDEDDDYPPGYVPSNDKSSKNLIGSAKDVIINMVNNIAANVLGGNPEGAAQSRANSSSPDLNVTETLGTPGQTVLPTSSGAVSLEEDPHDVKLTETTLVQGQEESQTSLSITPLPEASLTSPSSPESLSPTPVAPPVEPIVTLLPEEEESEEEDQSEESVPKEDEQTVKTDQSQIFSGLLEKNPSCLEQAPDSCSCVISLEEYLLQRCFPHSSVQSRNTTNVGLEGSRPESSFYSREPNPANPGIILSPTHALHTVTVETSAVEASVVVVPSFFGSEHRIDAGSLDLKPSLTSALATFPSTETFCSTETHAVDFLDPSNVDLDDLGLKEKTWVPATPHSEPTSSPVLTPKDREPDHEQVALTETNPSADPNAPSPSVTSSPVDQVAFVPPSASTDQPFTQPHTNENTAPTGTLPAVPNITEPSVAESKDEDFSEEAALGGSSLHLIQPGHSANGHAMPPPSSEFYAEMQGTTEAPVHGSNQKESVFMRLNNRIKALEVNMSLSGRYLEQLSQRYRKQMEEMQKAFNKTIIKLQNTSRIAEEQDQKQAESILVLQRQLENMTELVLNLSVRVSRLQREVSDRHSYLLLCVVLCLLVCVVVSIRFCRPVAENPSVGPDTPTPDFYSCCFPDRESLGYEDVAPVRRASYPMPSMQISKPQEPNVEIQTTSTGSKKKKRCKMKSGRRPEMVTPTLFSVPNGGVQNNSHHPQNTNLFYTEPLLSGGLGQPPLNLRDSSSEGSSEDSSQSDEPLFCGIATCRHLCDSLPHPKIHSKRRNRLKKRSSELQQLLQPAECKGPPVGPRVTLHGLIRDSSGLRTSGSRVSQL